MQGTASFKKKQINKNKNKALMRRVSPSIFNDSFHEKAHKTVGWKANLIFYSFFSFFATQTRLLVIMVHFVKKHGQEPPTFTRGHLIDIANDQPLTFLVARQLTLP